MFEEASERLLTALRAAYGDEPRWELRPNRNYGLYLYYDGDKVRMGNVRRLIDDTLRFTVGVILAPREPS
jgi:hypothetical protein